MHGDVRDLPDLVADAIMCYLGEHPDAADTEEGIQRWWLPAACRSASVETVRVALERLEHRGLVKTARVIGGRIVHRRRSVDT